jgi:hypothetical protein
MEELAEFLPFLFQSSSYYDERGSTSNELEKKQSKNLIQG